MLDATIVVEVHKKRMHDEPRLMGFVLRVEADGREWDEACGSQEHLEAHLQGMTMILSVLGRPVGSLSWPFPTTFGDPSGVRWTITPDGMPEMEELDGEGNVMERP